MAEPEPPAVSCIEMNIALWKGDNDARFVELAVYCQVKFTGGKF